jgi:hypothetical protein
MWPNNNTYFILILVLPFIYWHFSIFLKNGSEYLTSLSFLFFIFIFFGYLYSPLISLLGNQPWEHNLLITERINTCMLFALLSLFFFQLGYGSPRTQKSSDYKNLEKSFNLPNVKKGTIVILAVVYLGLFVFSIDGFENLFYSSTPRYLMKLQWSEAQSFFFKFKQIINVLLPFIGIILAILSSIFIFNNQGRVVNTILVFAIGWGGIFISSIESVWGFGRDSGAMLIIFLLIYIKTTKKINYTFVISIVLLVIMLGSNGISKREYFNPGIGNFVDSFFVSSTQPSSSILSFILDPNKNPINAVNSWTLKASILDFESINYLQNSFVFLLTLNPLPSVLIFPPSIGESLAIVAGSYGYSNVTTPAFAELYYLFGFFGAVPLFFLGRLFSYYDNRLNTENSLYYFLIILVLFLSIPLSLHNGLRAASRPLIYILFFECLRCVIFKKRVGLYVEKERQRHES